jgi:isopentenyl diphosphate isomerase/L-lactate dehydrogenase-like FMN-dependent dehydrogenase
MRAGPGHALSSERSGLGNDSDDSDITDALRAEMPTRVTDRPDEIALRSSLMDTPDRRAALKATAVFGGGALVAMGAATVARGAASDAAPATHYGPASATGSVGQVYQRAREALYPVCRVCPQCDGVACAGEFPGIGGLGAGLSFQNNFTSLQRVHLKLRPLSGNRKPDCSTVIFGQKLSFPAMAAPFGGLDVNFPHLHDMSEAQYFDAIIGGCVDAGTMGAVGDFQGDAIALTQARYDVVGRYPGRVIAGIKPRPNPNFMQVLRLAEAAKAFMVTIDIDSAGRGWQDTAADTAVEPKTVAQLREIVRATRLPLVVKGITTPDDALLALEAGAAGVCVSNHGGRVLDHTAGTAELLPAVADKVKGKMVILVDGCVHYGTDVLKYVALGADAVLVGRHLWRAAHGGGRPAVALFMKTMRDELTAAMVLTATPNIASVNRQILG